MNNIIFKIKKLDEDSLIDMMGEIHKMPFKVFFDRANETIYAIDIEPLYMEDLFALIEKYCTVVSVNIGQTLKKETYDVGPKYNFLLNRIARTVNVLEENDFIADYEIKSFLGYVCDEMYMRTIKPSFYLEVGQICECNLGQNMVGEMSGKVPCLILDVKGKMIRVIPVVKNLKFSNYGYLDTKTTKFENIAENFEDGYWAIWKMATINKCRVTQIIGQLSEEGINTVKEEVKKIFTE